MTAPTTTGTTRSTARSTSPLRTAGRTGPSGAPGTATCRRQVGPTGWGLVGGLVPLGPPVPPHAGDRWGQRAGDWWTEVSSTCASGARASPLRCVPGTAGGLAAIERLLSDYRPTEWIRGRIPSLMYRDEMRVGGAAGRREGDLWFHGVRARGGRILSLMCRHEMRVDGGSRQAGGEWGASADSAHVSLARRPG